MTSEYQVEAAGGVVVGEDGRICVVHRPRYDDWSLPKGKLDRGETFEQAAVREIEEETGLVVELGRELEPITYYDHKGRSKIVRYWEMTVPGEPGEFVPNNEVDERRWVTPEEALELLSYERDRALVAAFGA